MLNQESDNKSSSQNTWLVSFGDLLTLLLCFFICIIVQSPLNSEVESSQGIVKVQNETAPPTDPQQIGGAGTQLAPYKKESVAKAHGVKVLKLAFSEEDFTPDGQNLLLDGQERIESALKTSSYVVEQVTIESCIRGKLSEDDMLFEKAKQRAVSMKRQLLDVVPGLTEVEIRIRNLKERCDLLETLNPNSQAQGVIALKLK